MTKSLAVLGSTGSIGVQALEVAQLMGFEIVALTANSRIDIIEEQIRKFNPKFAAVADEKAAADLKIKVADTSTTVLSGTKGVEECARCGADTVLNSIVGIAGLAPTLAAIEQGSNIALANKETLVAGGKIVMESAKAKGVSILPVDSEHSAIFQSLQGCQGKSQIKRLILTASGGPFFGYNREQLEGITVERALAHPTWKMGAKITIDSATLMNKGFEVIEAVHLFDVSPDKVEVVVHRESIIHSAVEYIDNSIIAQMSKPDMRHCVQYALTHPRRLPADGTLAEADLFSMGKLTFGRPDTTVFPLLALARDCIAEGGALPCVLNAANEVVVAAFLDERIRFCEIPELVARTVDDLRAAASMHTYDQLMEADALARETARTLLCMH